MHIGSGLVVSRENAIAERDDMESPESFSNQ